MSQALGAQCLLVTSDLGTDDHDSSAHPLMLDTEVVGRLDSTGNVTDVDVFRFDANPHRVYLLEVDAGPRVVVDMADSSGAVRTSASGHQLRL
ncbi:MAG: hypothetical protein ACXWLG_04775, partial [Myxococcaceae bacterium]